MAPTEITYSHNKMLQFYSYSKHDNWFSLGYIYSAQTITLETGLSWTKNYHQFTISWFVGSSVDYIGYKTGMFFKNTGSWFVFTAVISWKTLLIQNMKEGASYLWIIHVPIPPDFQSHLPEKNVYQSKEKILKTHKRNWTIKYVVRNHCHSWGRETKKNFYHKNIFPQKSSHISFLFKNSV